MLRPALESSQGERILWTTVSWLLYFLGCISWKIYSKVNCFILPPKNLIIWRRYLFLKVHQIKYYKIVLKDKMKKINFHDKWLSSVPLLLWFNVTWKESFCTIYFSWGLLNQILMKVQKYKMEKANFKTFVFHEYWKKHPAYERHRISRPMGIVATPPRGF